MICLCLNLTFLNSTLVADSRPVNSGTILKSNSQEGYYYFIHRIFVYNYFVNNKLKVAKDECNLILLIQLILYMICF
jgi:hypothetical protein